MIGMFLFLSLVALVSSTLVYPLVLQFAKDHDIVDNPNARKLQRIPIPVMGGLVVYIGILISCLVLMTFRPEPIIAYGLVAMTVMLVIGMWDDIKDLSATFRFVVEIVLVSVFIWKTGYYIDDLHGLFGIDELNPWLGIPLSVFTGVGLINAVNLIDGVDGYSSGYGMLACICFALVFHSAWSTTLVMMSGIVIGALLPFFLHNVFGVRSKMFIGDGGTLMLGMLLVMFLFSALSSKSKCTGLEDVNLGLVAMALSVLSIPIFDTLRVMFMRILRGKSPFRPDRTHFHHLFIDMGFSHLGAALTILAINFGVVLVWVASWLLGASVTVQFFNVVIVAGLVTFGFYKLMKYQQNHGPLDGDGYPQGTALWHFFCKIGDMSHREKGRFWRWMRWLMDRSLYRLPSRHRKA
ncbi:MAG: undecaprenyl/decaprenyl-phosphate alpha-N-acetylglucosaminyl 1-phosphate transferase [Prevotella sp.]|nr:undecaprenyl/decaprenyl-phosphate alpha-N-acetylglucosaminyl 1-phosphate transferase [Prevotella sp.]